MKHMRYTVFGPGTKFELRTDAQSAECLTNLCSRLTGLWGVFATLKHESFVHIYGFGTATQQNKAEKCARITFRNTFPIA